MTELTRLVFSVMGDAGILAGGMALFAKLINMLIDSLDGRLKF